MRMQAPVHYMSLGADVLVLCLYGLTQKCLHLDM